MDELISLLDAVYHTMDTIAIVGIDNQDKFVGCAKAVKSVSQQLQAEQAEKAAPAELQVEQAEKAAPAELQVEQAEKADHEEPNPEKEE